MKTYFSETLVIPEILIPYNHNGLQRGITIYVWSKHAEKQLKKIWLINLLEL